MSANKNSIKSLRKTLNLNKGIWKDMNDVLIQLAFTHPSALQYSLIPRDILLEMKDKYNTTDYERFEFFGDRVLDMIVSQWLLNKNWKYGTPRLYSNLKAEIVKNVSLKCYMMTKNLCNKIIGFNVPEKACADMFEAIIGVLYYYLTQIKEESYISFFYIEEWLIETFELEKRLDNVLIGKKSC